VPRARLLVLPLIAALLLAAACGGSSSTSKSASSSSTSTTVSSAPVTVHLGVFPNVTHAPGLVGVGKGIFATALGKNTLKVSYFNAGPEASQALLSGAVDATYIGPNPAINAFAKSGGKAIRIIAGSTSGGAALVVKSSINGPADLKGKKLASPQLGNTQDVALRAWLKKNGLKTDTSGGGDVSITPQANADTLAAFTAGTIDGAWVPEPWATRLVTEGKGKVLVNEKDLWPGGQFVTTQLIVATTFLDAHPDAVQALLEGHVDAVKFVNDNASEAKSIVNDQIKQATGKALKPEVLDAAWANLTFTNDPIASSLQKSADDAIALGLLDKVDLHGIYSIDLLNKVLAAKGEAKVQAL
jgi:NitT/TauT family transport system substrate-binding protein